MKLQFLHIAETPIADALVDTGATHNFLSPAFVKHHHLELTPLNRPRLIRNIDGTSNKGGRITHFIDLDVTLGSQPQHWFHKEKRTLRFYIANLGQDHVILGFLWMAAEQPKLNWTDSDQNPKVLMGPTNWLAKHGWTPGDEVIMCLRHATHAQQLAEAAWVKEEQPWTTRVPSELHDFERSLANPNLNASPHPNHGITPSNYCQTPLQYSTVKYTLYPKPNKWHKIHFSRNTWRRSTSDHPSLLTPHPSSLSRKRMGVYAPYKITVD